VLVWQTAVVLLVVSFSRLQWFCYLFGRLWWCGCGKECSDVFLFSSFSVVLVVFCQTAIGCGFAVYRDLVDCLTDCSVSGSCLTDCGDLKTSDSEGLASCSGSGGCLTESEVVLMVVWQMSLVLVIACTATEIPFIYSFSGNSVASAPISTFMCL
jgi:hypothetical protein